MVDDGDGSISSSCHRYEKEEEEIFRLNGGIKLNAIFVASGAAVSSLVVLYLLVVWIRIFDFPHQTRLHLAILSINCLITAIFMSLSLNFQTKQICNSERYSLEWYQYYPPDEYPQYSYFPQFSHCTYGNSSKYAIAAIVLWYTVSILLSLSNCYFTSTKKQAQQQNNNKVAHLDNVETPMKSSSSGVIDFPIVLDNMNDVVDSFRDVFHDEPAVPDDSATCVSAISEPVNDTFHDDDNLVEIVSLQGSTPSKSQGNNNVHIVGIRKNSNITDDDLLYEIQSAVYRTDDEISYEEASLQPHVTNDDGT